MSPDQDREARKNLEQELWTAIAALEQILDVMPNDLTSLEALAHAYEEIGDKSRARDYFIRLGLAFVDKGDLGGAQEVLEKLLTAAEDDPRVKELADQIEAASARSVSVEGDRGSKASKAGAQVEQFVRSRVSIDEELTFAWNLLLAKQIGQEEYASVVHDLTEMSATDSSSTISVLHVLEFRASKSLDRVMGYVAKECGTPIVGLSNFGFPVEAITALNIEFMVRRGVIVLGFIGPEALVVVMNPYNKELRKEVESRLGRKCHFFICLPSEFDQAVAKIKAQLEAQPEPEGEG